MKKLIILLLLLVGCTDSGLVWKGSHYSNLFEDNVKPIEQPFMECFPLWHECIDSHNFSDIETHENCKKEFNLCMDKGG